MEKEYVFGMMEIYMKVIFKNDKIEGKGISYNNDGNIYEGDFKNDKKEGKGIMYYKNGEKEEGDWENDK